MGVSKTLISGGITNTEALTGVVMPKDFIKAPERVMQSVMPKAPTYSYAALAPPPPAPQVPQDNAAPAKAAAGAAAGVFAPSANQKRDAFGTASLIGD